MSFSYISLINEMIKDMKNLTKIFKALSDQNRIRIMKMLEEKELCLCEISKVLRLANSTASKHLSILRDAGLIVDYKEGKWVNFRLAQASESMYVREIQKLIKEWLPDDETIRADRKQLLSVNRAEICGN